MTRKLRLLDLFSGAGGCSVGYARAGFEVVGVDLHPQPNYPYEFIQADALAVLRRGLPHDFYKLAESFDAIHASPPCQSFTAYRRKGHGVGDSALNLIPETRALLQATGLPYVIENVEQAREHLRQPVRMCGSSYGLDIRRHRLFETNWPLTPWPCSHEWQKPRFPPATNRTNLRSTVEIGVWRIPLDVQQAAMEIDWMTLPELSQAIPPAYTEHIGNQLAQYLSTERDQSRVSLSPSTEVATCPPIAESSPASQAASS